MDKTRERTVARSTSADRRDVAQHNAQRLSLAVENLVIAGILMLAAIGLAYRFFEALGG